MELDLSAPAVLNAGGAFLFLIVGLGVLAIARGERRARLIGATAATFGLLYVVQNLVLVVDGDPLASAILAVCAAVSLVTVLALTRDLARPLGRKRWLAAFASANVVVFVAAGYVLASWDLHEILAAGGSGPFRGVSAVANSILFAEQTALIVLVGALAARFRSAAPGGPERKQLATLALAFAPFVVYLTVFAGSALGYFFNLGPGHAAFGIVTLATSVLALAALVPLVSTDPRASRIERSAFWVSFVIGIVALPLAVAASYSNISFGAYGIVRTIGVSFLVVGILRYDLLGVPLPQLAVKRGALATGALASLLIVAQVGQNFLSARYGLIMGGVVAGALVFAASPIQRALEGRRPVEVAPAVRASDEEIYRNALRVALRDKRLTRDEEVHLHRLATRMGLSGERAHEMLVDLEREMQEDAR